MTRKFKLMVLATLIAVAVGGAAAYAVIAAQRYESTDNAAIRLDRVVVSPKVGGYVIAVNVSDNQKVGAGDVLVQIDPADFKARIAQERATLLSREAALETLDRRKALNRAEIAQAVSSLDVASAQAAKSIVDRQRDQKLLTEGYATRQQSELSQLNARVAVSGETRSRAQLDATHKQTAMLDAEAKQLRAEVQQSRATVDLLELDLNNASIVAPSSGLIGNKTVQVGQYVRPGTQLLTLVADSQAYVVANFKETQMALLRPAQPVRVRVDAYPDLTLTGHIDSIAPATGSEFSLLPPENATGNFTKIVQRVPIRIALDDVPESLQRLRSGMSVQVRVDTQALMAGVPEPKKVGAAAVAVRSTRPQ